MRSGDRPTGKTAETDQSAAASEVTGKRQDIHGGEALPPIPPSAGESAAGRSASGPGLTPPWDAPQVTSGAGEPRTAEFGAVGPGARETAEPAGAGLGTPEPQAPRLWAFKPDLSSGPETPPEPETSPWPNTLPGPETPPEPEAPPWPNTLPGPETPPEPAAPAWAKLPPERDAPAWPKPPPERDAPAWPKPPPEPEALSSADAPPGPGVPSGAGVPRGAHEAGEADAPSRPDVAAEPGVLPGADLPPQPSAPPGPAVPAPKAPRPRTLGLRRRGSRHRSGPAGARSSARPARPARPGLLGLSWPSRAGRPPRYPDAGGLSFARITVLPTVLLASWLLAGLPLLLAGVFVPGPELLITIAAVVALTTGLRRMPTAWPRALPGAARRASRPVPPEGPGTAPPGPQTIQAGAATAAAVPETDRSGAVQPGTVQPGIVQPGMVAEPAAGQAAPGAGPQTTPPGGAPTAGEAARPAALAPAEPPQWAAWWGLAGTIVVAAGFALWQFLFNSENVIVLRDPGTYLQTGYWIAQHGSLPIPQSLAAFGGAHAGLAFSSTGFFSSGTSVVPGVLSGLPLLLAAAFWVHGSAAAAAMGPILGGFAILAFGGLAGRLAGPQWAPAAALVLAFTLPEQYTSRGSFSETAMQILLFGGLSLIVDGMTLGLTGAGFSPRGRLGPPKRGWANRLAGMSWAPRWLARSLPPHWPLLALGGLALGLTTLVRFDGLLDVLPAIPFVGVLLLRRWGAAVVPFCFCLAVGVIYGVADAYLLARPFVASLHPLPELIGLLAAWLAAVTLAVVELLRLPGFRRRMRTILDGRPVRWLPDAGALLAVCVLIALAARPYLQVVRGPSTGGAASYVASLQRLEHLVVDPGRLYAEDTLYWVIWYVGLPAVLLGGLGLALLTRRVLRALITRRDTAAVARAWALPFAVICWGGAAVLWNPETAPDQPWASRRLVPLVLPGLVLFSAWAAAWLRGRARSRGASRTAASLVAGFCVAALLVPTAATTFGFGLTHSGGNGGLRTSANGPALKRTGQGELAAMDRMCSAIGPSATVVIMDYAVAQPFSQTIRGMCGVPVGSVAGQSSATVESVLSGIEHSGRRPVLLATRPTELYNYGSSPVQVLNLTTMGDPHTLTQPPSSLTPEHYAIWMTSLGQSGSGV